MAKAKEQKPLENTGVSATGLMHIHGRDGVGKTTLALTAISDLSEICLLDADSSKSKALATEIGVGEYHDITAMGIGMTEVEYHKMVLKTINGLDKHYALLILDNGAEFFKGAHSYVAVNHPEFRKVWRGDAPIIGGIEWQEARRTHLPRVYAKLQQKADLVIIITHEKKKSINGVRVPGLTEPIGDESLRTAAGIVLRLIKNTRSDDLAPVGLVIKNTGTIKDGKAIRCFPERIAPCDWDKIRHYLENPISGREATPEEVPSEFEQHLIEGTLNQEQQEMLRWRKNMMELQVDAGLSGAVLEVAAQNKDMNPVYLVREIVSELKDGYPDLTIKQVQKILDKSLED